MQSPEGEANVARTIRPEDSEHLTVASDVPLGPNKLLECTQEDSAAAPRKNDELIRCRSSRSAPASGTVEWSAA